MREDFFFPAKWRIDYTTDLLIVKVCVVTVSLYFPQCIIEKSVFTSATWKQFPGLLWFSVLLCSAH